MVIFVHVLVAGLLSTLAFGLVLFWLPLLAATRRRPETRPAEFQESTAPRVCVLSACRDGAACIPGLVKTVKDQHYPADRRRLLVVTDNCTDASADLARSLGAEVYERRDLNFAGKGNAISEVLSRKLRFELFDILLVLDVDARLDPNVLRKMAGYFHAHEPVVVSCTTFVKNPTQSLFTHVGFMIQALLRLHQEGRAALGLDAALHGSHGYALSREALERLEWRTTTGLIAEDMELRLRCTLKGVTVRYARDLAVFNDVTADARAAHDQRRRWNSTYLPLIPRYAGSLLRRWLAGDRKSFDTLFALLLLPSFGNFFLYITLTLLFLGGLSVFHPGLRVYAGIAFFLWVADIAYFLRAFAVLKIPLGGKELVGFLAHLGIRALALVESVFFVHVKIWPPAPHEEDKC